jgi:hypothetical protein
MNRHSDWDTVHANRRIEIRFPEGVGYFSLLQGVQTRYGAHKASYPMGTEGSFPGVKRPELETNRPILHFYTRLHGVCLAKHRDNFTILCVSLHPTSVRD